MSRMRVFAKVNLDGARRPMLTCGTYASKQRPKGLWQ